MANEHHQHDNGRDQQSKSRILMGFAAFAAIAGVFLLYEHRAHVFAGGGLLFVWLAACIGIHFFMHGGHGGHGGHGHQGEHKDIEK